MGAAALAQNLGVSPLIVGLTIVGFGTSAPEMLVSSVAAYRGSPGLAMGNAIGSNITNVALVLGIAALICPITVNPKVILREAPILLAVNGIAFLLLMDGNLGRMDGAILISGLALMVGWVVVDGVRGRHREEIPPEIADELPDPMPTAKATLWIVVGLAVLLGGSELLVHGAVTVARFFGASDSVIGLTVVAFGTSLPELAATVVAARRGEHDIAVGNVIGSNMFNTLGVLALPGLIRPSPVDPAVLTRDMPMMLGSLMFFWVLARVVPPRDVISRPHGALLVLCFLGYLGWIALDIL